MIIILEGGEKTGKSTLAEKIQKENYFAYYRSTHQKDKKTNLEEAIKHDWRFFLDIYSQIKYDFDIIFDRSFISQYVYSTLFRKQNILKYYNNLKNYEKIFKNYCNILYKVEHLIIYCTRKIYLTTDTDDYIDLKFSDQIEKKFNFFFKKIGYNLNIIECKFEDDIEDNIKKIQKEIRL